MNRSPAPNRIDLRSDEPRPACLTCRGHGARHAATGSSNLASAIAADRTEIANVCRECANEPCMLRAQMSDNNSENHDGSHRWNSCSLWRAFCKMGRAMSRVAQTTETTRTISVFLHELSPSAGQAEQ